MFLKIRDTLLSTVSQQIAGVIIFLTIPRILTVEDYAITVFVGVLLSFVSLADFGFTFVYSRKLPALYHVANESELNQWHSTAFWFPFTMAFLMGLFLAVIYFIKFESYLQALCVFLIPAGMSLIAYISAKYSARGDFFTYRNLNIEQSVLKIFTVPIVFICGILGWFVGQLLISLPGIKRLLKDDLPNIKCFDTKLIFTSFKEGILLIGVFSLWMQLMGLGRLLAASNYSKVIIANYGIMNAAYQILTSLVIAAFVPFSVHTLKMVSINEKNAAEMIFKVIFLALPIMFFLILITQKLAPYLFEFFFQKYQYDAKIFDSLLYGLMALPIVLTLGNLFVAKQKVFHYLVLLGLSFLVGIFSFYLMLSEYGDSAAAIAQFIGLSACAFLMLLVSIVLFRNSIDKKVQKILSIFGIWVLVALFEFKVVH